MESRETNPKYLQLLPRLSIDCQISKPQVSAVVSLLQASNTVPFIARYRKEATGGLDEVQIRLIEERLTYLSELESRRETILHSIESQGKLSEALRTQILACEGKTELEDLYVPYKPKRRTRAMIARERGLEPLAILILEQPLTTTPKDAAQAYINPEKELSDCDQVLRGARDIVAEIVAERAEFRAHVREVFKRLGHIKSSKRTEKDEPTKFEQYYDFSEALHQIPSHRYLAIARGEREGVLRMNLAVPTEASLDFAHKLFSPNPQSPFLGELHQAIEDAYQRLLSPSVETDVCVELKMKSDREAIEVFAENLRNILLSAPLGAHTVLGIDPGMRTGCKCAVVESTGKFVYSTVINLISERGAEQAHKVLSELIAIYKPAAIAIGNGTYGRETEAFVRKVVGTSIVVVSVSESGASVYSASEIAREEFPDLDLTIRGAISIARRLQDPLSELVKVEPKALGVGQYQHDVYQPLLEKKLHEVVESSVNQVGVEINTASAPLLSYVAGIGPSLAKNIVSYREHQGPFKSRQELKKVPGLGPKTFEQAAGFLRLRGGENPLDASAVHPERYGVVEHIARDMGLSVVELMGQGDLVNRINISNYQSEHVGLLTLKDMIEELKKPGRDPRASFERPAFREDINTINDLSAGMVLEGIVTNVAAFGAFVDIGVHQDGLVHISELSTQFVRDPSSVVRAGDRLKVEVLAVDVVRKRISLSARLGQKRDGAKPERFKAENHRTRPEPRATLGSLASFAHLKTS